MATTVTAGLFASEALVSVTAPVAMVFDELAPVTSPANVPNPVKLLKSV